MLPSARAQFNSQFNSKKYESYLSSITRGYPGTVEFRLAETPLFIPLDFKKQLLSACDTIIDELMHPEFKNKTQLAIPEEDKIPGEEMPCRLLCFDFGICETANGNLEPQLIEMQGFASLFAFQVRMADSMEECFDLPSGFSPYLGGFNRSSYLKTMQELLTGPFPPEEVVLLEIQPHQQKTRLDFYLTRDYWGIHPICLSELIVEGRALYYFHPHTKNKTRIKRIYNRFIFDDLRSQQKNLPSIPDIHQNWEVEWLPHPSWFYRISKYTLPLLHHPNIPETHYLNQLERIPENLNDYVLKPLFSFAGQGVVIDVTMDEIMKIKNPENWILQRKVNYASCISTPGTPAKAEIRMMYIHHPDCTRPKPVINLARLSKGKMIGVNYNRDLDWVGGSICYFEEE